MIELKPNERKFGLHIATAKNLVSNFISSEGWDVIFENGYGASIVRGPHTYGGPFLFELAVIHNDQLCYKSSITKDVIGYLTEDDVVSYCDKIAQLTPNNDCTHSMLYEHELERIKRDQS